MTESEGYSIRLKDLKEGHHRFRFELDDRFFEKHENSIFSKGNIACRIELDKHHSLVTMQFHMDGHIRVACDRCVADIALPVANTYPLIVKYREDISADDRLSMENEGILLISQDTAALDLQPYLRDFALLMVPARMVYDCRAKAPYPCDEAVLQQIGFFEEEGQIEETTKDSVWNALKDIRWEESDN